MYSYRVLSLWTRSYNRVSILIQVVNVFLYHACFHERTQETSLNPYSGGKCIPINASWTEVSVLRCLNPYSGGKCIPIKSKPYAKSVGFRVSILIQVVNVFLWFFRIGKHRRGIVSILIQVVNVFLSKITMIYLLNLFVSQSLFRW